MGIFSDIARQFNIPKQLPKQTGFFSDIAERFNLIPTGGIAEPGSQLEKVLKSSAQLREQIKEKITKPVIKALPMGIGEILSRTSEEQKRIAEVHAEKYGKNYTYGDLGKDVANLGLSFTVNPLVRLGLTGQELITGKKAGIGKLYGFEDVKTFPKEIMGSYQSLYKEDIKAGGSEVGAGLRVGLTMGFDLLLGYGMAEKGLPLVRNAARGLPESLLFKIKTERIPVDEIIGSLTGGNPTKRATDFIAILSNEERKSLFRLSRAYEKAGGKPIEIVEKTPTKLGEFAELEARKPALIEIRPERQLPGYARPSMEAGAIFPKSERVGGAYPEPPKEIFARQATSLEQKSPTAKSRGYNTIPDKPGYEKVYKPYGENGAGYYYSKIITEVAESLAQEVPIVPKTKGIFSDIAKQFDIKKPTEKEMMMIEKEAMESSRDEIDDIIAGKIKMRPPARDVRTDWRENLGSGNYMRMFGGGEFARTPDEIATDLGITENELSEIILNRISAKEKFKIRMREIEEPRKFFETEIKDIDINKLFKSAPKLENIISPPTEPIIAGMPKKIISEREKTMVKDYSEKVINDFNALDGFQNKNIIQDLNEIGGYNFKDIEELKEVLNMIKPIKIRMMKITPEQKRINKLIMATEKEQAKMLNLAQRNAIKNLHKVEMGPKITTIESALLKQRFLQQQKGAIAGKKIGEKIGEFKTRSELNIQINKIREQFKSKAMTTRNMKVAVSQFLGDHLPVSERGGFVNAIAKVETPTQLSKVFERANQKALEYTAEVQMAKEASKKRSNIAFIRELSDLGQTAMNEIKTELNINKPISKMLPEELDKVLAKVKERMKYKFGKGYKPTPEITEKLKLKPIEKEQPFTEEFYKKGREEAKKKYKPEKRGEAVKFVESILTPISTRLGNIAPILRTSLRKVVFDTNKNVVKDRKFTDPFIKKVSKISKINKDDFFDLDLAAKNGDIDKLDELAGKYGFKKELEEIRPILDNLYKRANEVKMEVGYNTNYFPRFVKDSEGLLMHLKGTENWSIIDKAIKNKEMKLGRDLNIDERAYIADTLLRGFKTSAVTLARPGAAKERAIDIITPEINKYYDNFINSLQKYIIGMNRQIEARKFFGKHLKVKEEIIGEVNLDSSIGSYVTNLIADGKITIKQERELGEILKAYFNEKGSGNIVRAFKDLAYIDTLGNLTNTVTQIGDLSVAIYASKARKALPEALKSIIGKSIIKKEDIYLAARDIGIEMEEKGFIRKFSDVVLYPLGKIDRMGAESLIGGVFREGRDLAIANDKKFIDDMRTFFQEPLFPKETSEKVIEDFRNGVISDDIKFYLFSRLLDFSPRALTEMPEKYLTSGNGRIFYILKTFSIKQIDILRREAFQKMAQKGTRMEGLRNLTKLITLFMVFGATADTIKNTMLGKDTKWDDLLVNNIAKFFFLNRYAVERIGKDGLIKVVGEQIIPPFPAADSFVKDISALWTDFDKSADINELRTVQEIPVAGNLYYWWFGKGRSLQEKGKKKTTTKSTTGAKGLPWSTKTTTQKLPWQTSTTTKKLPF